MAGSERSVCWVSRPSVRFWGFLVALTSLVISASLAVLDVDPVHLVGVGSGLVAVAMGIARPYVFRDGAR